MTTLSVSPATRLQWFQSPYLLPLSLLTFGLVNFLVLNGLLVVFLPQVAEYWFRNPIALLATHLFTLGFVTAVIMGAMYQLVPVMLETRLWSQGLGYVQATAYVVGVYTLLVGFSLLSASALIFGGSLVWISMVLFLVNIGTTMRKASQWHHGATFLVFSLSYLFAVCTMGVVMAYNIHTGILGATTRGHLSMHAVLGFGGWFTLTIMGMAYRLIPLFTLAHHKPGRQTWAALSLTNIGIIGLGISHHNAAAQEVKFVFLGIAATGMLIFLNEMRQIIRSRPRKVLDLSMRFAVVALLFLIIALLAAAVYVIVPEQYLIPAHGTGLLYLGALGWVSLMVVGHMYKIVPFLVWTARYGPKVGKERVPILRDMYDADPATWALRSLVTGVVFVTTGLWFEWMIVAQTGALITAMGATLFGWGMITVYRR